MTFLFEHLPEQRAPQSFRSAPLRHPKEKDQFHAWPLNAGINVVLFAGMGGACQGIEEAGYPIHVAVNHDPIAIAAHRALNPHTRHLQADIYEVCPLDATGGRFVNILWASPDCRDHSSAKGGAPRSPRVRSMPWQVCRWVGVLEKRAQGVGTVFLENVREIRGWGPLIAKRDKATGRVIKLDGTVAAKGEVVPVREQQLIRDPRHLGRTYRAWVKHMRGLGKNYEDRDLGCADYGVPTIRKRLFGIALPAMRTPQWPVVTHAHRHSDAVQQGRLAAHVPACSFIDWKLPMKSIFGRDKELAAATLRRVAVGTMRYVVNAAEPFLIHTNHAGGDRVHSAAEPSKTLTAAHRGEMAVVAPHITKFRAGAVGDDMRDSLATVTANGYSERPGGAIPLGVVGAHMIQTGYGERPGQQPRALDIQDAIGTQVTNGGKHAVVGVHLQDMRTRSIGSSAEDAAPTQTQVDHTAAVGAWMVQRNTGVIGHAAADPVSTMTTLGTQQEVAGAYLIHQRGTSTATSAEEAIRAMTTGGDRGADHVGVAAAFLHHQYSQGGQHHPVDVPIGAISTVDRTMITTADLEIPPLTAEQLAGACRVAEFLRSQGVWDGGHVVTVGPWVVVDIAMRMLTRWEAAAAHELKMPETIRVLETPKVRRSKKMGSTPATPPAPVWIERPLTKTESFRLVGNSVPKRMARLLVEANVPQAFAEAA